MQSGGFGVRNSEKHYVGPFVFRKVGTQATGLQGVLSFLTTFIESIESDILNPPAYSGDLASKLDS